MQRGISGLFCISLWLYLLPYANPGAIAAGLLIIPIRSLNNSVWMTLKFMWPRRYRYNIVRIYSLNTSMDSGFDKRTVIRLDGSRNEDGEEMQLVDREVLTNYTLTM